MKIAIETDVLAHYAKTGVYFYTQRLLKATIEVDRVNNYTLVYFGQPSDAKEFGLPLTNVKVKAITRVPRKLNSLLLRTPLGLPIDRLAGIKPDVFIFPTFARWPLAYTRHSITIIYDTVHVDRPQDIKTWHFQRYLRTAIPRAVKNSTKIIAISEYTKRRLMDLYGTPADKIMVITPAVDVDVFKPARDGEVSNLKAKYRISREYLLYLGTLEPRKNIPGIIEAYQSLPSELRKKYQLVLAGGKGWDDKQIEQTEAQVSPSDLVRIGYVDPEDIVSLYSGASLFLYPSLFEGWGMQVLEAMACGVPVLAADNSSLPEAGGQAAAYVKTDDQADLNQRLGELLDNPAELESMRQKGFEQVKRFTWENSANELLKLFAQVEKS